MEASIPAAPDAPPVELSEQARMTNKQHNRMRKRLCTAFLLVRICLAGRRTLANPIPNEKEKSFLKLHRDERLDDRGSRQRVTGKLIGIFKDFYGVVPELENIR